MANKQTIKYWLKNGFTVNTYIDIKPRTGCALKVNGEIVIHNRHLVVKSEKGDTYNTYKNRIVLLIESISMVSPRAKIGIHVSKIFKDNKSTALSVARNLHWRINQPFTSEFIDIRVSAMLESQEAIDEYKEKQAKNMRCVESTFSSFEIVKNSFVNEIVRKIKRESNDKDLTVTGSIKCVKSFGGEIRIINDLSQVEPYVRQTLSDLWEDGFVTGLPMGDDNTLVICTANDNNFVCEITVIENDNETES